MRTYKGCKLVFFPNGNARRWIVFAGDLQISSARGFRSIAAAKRFINTR